MYYANDLQRQQLLSKIPCLDLKAFANYIGVHWTLLARIKFGVVSASDEMKARIKKGLYSIREEIINIPTT